MPNTVLPNAFRLAPPPEQVFIRPDFHTQYFHPLLSLELSDIFNDLEGPIHFIDPIEPYDGYIGDYTKAFHTYYCRENWISFKIVDGRYEFEGAEEFFEKSYWKTHEVPDTIHESVRDGWKEAVNDYYLKKSAKYDEWRAALVEDMSANLTKHEIKRDHFGGRPHEANWICTEFPLSIDKEDEKASGARKSFYYPLTEDGRRFRYIGFVEAFDWSCAIHLFYDPKEKRALQTFDWT